MSVTTSFLCDHPKCDARADHPQGHVMQPETLERWACIYVGTSLTPHHLCPEHLQAALGAPADPAESPPGGSECRCDSDPATHYGMSGHLLACPLYEPAESAPSSPDGA